MKNDYFLGTGGEICRVSPKSFFNLDVAFVYFLVRCLNFSFWVVVVFKSFIADVIEYQGLLSMPHANL